MEAKEVEAATPNLAGGDGDVVQPGLAGRFRGSGPEGEQGLALLAAR
ncbi:hypothetical protein ACFVW8_28865 [Streptomyces sp. NPDC058221]